MFFLPEHFETDEKVCYRIYYIVGIYLLKVRRSGVFIGNFEHISHLALVLTLNM